MNKTPTINTHGIKVWERTEGGPELRWDGTTAWFCFGGIALALDSMDVSTLRASLTSLETEWFRNMLVENGVKG